MKKFLLITIFGLVLSSMCISCNKCESNNDNVRIEKSKLWDDTRILRIEGHKYIRTSTIDVKGGVCIIHAESCECKNDSNYNK